MTTAAVKSKRKPCRYFNTSKGCSSGDSCRFAHEPPKPSGGADQIPRRKSNKKCRYGASCNDASCAFVHPSSTDARLSQPKPRSKDPSTSDSQPPSQRAKIDSAPSATNTPKKKKPKRCKFGSTCRKKNCKFSHPEPKVDKNNANASPATVATTVGSAENKNMQHLAQDLLHTLNRTSTKDPNDALNLASELLHSMSNGHAIVSPSSSSLSSKENLARESKTIDQSVMTPPGFSPRTKQRRNSSNASTGYASQHEYFVGSPSSMDLPLQHLGQDLLHQLDFATEEPKREVQSRRDSPSKQAKKPRPQKQPRAEEKRREQQQAAAKRQELEQAKVAEKQREQQEFEAKLKRLEMHQTEEKRRREEQQREVRLEHQKLEAQKRVEERKRQAEERERQAEEREARLKREQLEQARAEELKREEEAKKKQEEELAAKLKQEKLEKARAKAKRKEEERKKREQEELEAQREQERIEQAKHEEQMREAEEAKKKAAEDEKAKLARMREEVRKQQAAAKERKLKEKSKKQERRLKELEAEYKRREAMWTEELASEKEYVGLMVDLCTAEFVRQNKNTSIAKAANLSVEKFKNDKDATEKLRGCCKVAYRELYRYQIKSRIVVAGLDKDMNGRTGVIRFWDEAKDAFSVGLDTKKGNVEVRYLKPGNLEAAPQPKSKSKKDKPIDRFVLETDGLFLNRSLDFVITASVVDAVKAADSKEQFLQSLMDKRDALELQRKLDEEAERKREEEDRKRRAEKKARENAEWEERKKEMKREQEEYKEFMKDYKREQRKSSRSFEHGFFTMGGGCSCPRCEFERRFRGYSGYSFFEDFFFASGDYCDEDDYDDYDFDERWSTREAEKRQAENEKQADILGVPVDASPQVIKSVYRIKALQYHPDKYREDNAGGLSKEESTDQFKMIQNAYDHLMSNFDD